MNKILLMAGVATVLFAANANALDFQQYVSVKGTYNDMSNKVKWVDFNPEKDGESTGKNKLNDEVFGASFAYGVKTGPIRTELELNWHDDAEEKDEGEKIKIENNSVMLNAYYDIDTGTKFTPYVGAGLGMARLKVKHTGDDSDENWSKSSNEFAWQLGAGVSYAATDNVSVDLGYRYVDNGSFVIRDEEERNKWRSRSNEFYLGVRYAF